MTEVEKKKAEKKARDRERSFAYYWENRPKILERKKAQNLKKKYGVDDDKPDDIELPKAYTANDVTVGAVAKLYRNMFNKAGVRVLSDTKKRGVVVGKYKHFFLVEYAPHIRKSYQYCQLHRKMEGDVIILGGQAGGGKKNG